MKKNKLLGVLLILTCLGCRNDIKDNFESMLSSSFHLPYEQFVRLSNDSSIIVDSPLLDNKYQYYMVNYYDSSECAPCVMPNIIKWNKYLHYEKDGRIRFIFLFSSRNDMYSKHEIYKAYKCINWNHDIYIDTCDAFKDKTKIPDNEFFHTFMIDNMGNVVFVGNPIENQRFDSLFHKIVDQQPTMKES